MKNLLLEYIQEVGTQTKRGDSTESSYYPALKHFLEEYSEGARKKAVHVTVLPKKTEAGNPDFRVWDGKHSQVGYIEAKPPSANLDQIETTDQLKRYLHTFPNLILTNFYEFRLYRNGQERDRAVVARPIIASKLKKIPPAEHEDEFFRLIDEFFRFSLPTKFTAESLAKDLAKRTRFLRDQVIKEELREASSESGKNILSFYEAFQKHLIANLKPDEFADLYAQTITYGLFAARTRADGFFNRKLAYDLIPKTIGILRDIFHFISFDPPPQMEVSVDDIAEVLAVADVKSILREYFKGGKGSDPIFHFYETFLAEYNPEERERRGVYYTPEPVVSYIVRSLNIILKEKFGREDGFATPSVTVLDPAAGTLTFLAEAAKIAVQEHVQKYGSGSKGKFIEDHILKHFYAFELMMAPYAAGHLKMGYLLEELGHKLTGDERFQFYLTNTLDMEELVQTSLPGMASLSEESHLAGKLKKNTPILVILGNPPYSFSSPNQGKWIEGLIEDYKKIDGAPVKEKKIGVIQDDYVKFLRFAQWKIDQAGTGIVGMITNNSYLDSPAFRGMRANLMNSFHEMFLLNLHGSSLKKEQAPDGSKDENVFDIRQGVVIALFVKRADKGKRIPMVRYADVWGTRAVKYGWLDEHDVSNTRWINLTPKSEFYFFIRRDEESFDYYNSFPAVTQILPTHGVGIITRKDKLTIRWSKNDIWDTVLNFSRLDPELARSAYDLGEDSANWDVKWAQEDLRRSGPDRSHIVPILYRPLDIRYTYYTGKSNGFHSRPCREVMHHLLQPNIALIAPRQFKEESGAMVTMCIAGHKTVSAFDINYVFPLYAYAEEEKIDLFSQQANGERVSNVAPQLVETLVSAYKRRPSPEDVFHYTYAVLYSNAYREKYSQFLKTDFPRVPFTKDHRLFTKLADIGEQLVDLHLLRSKKLAKPIAKCEGSGALAVVNVAYDAKRKRVYINPEKYFIGLSSESWQYHIGGYQVAEKWLKDRKGRTLTSDEVAHYCKVITALTETIKIQETLDVLFKQVEKSLLNIKL